LAKKKNFGKQNRRFEVLFFSQEFRSRRRFVKTFFKIKNPSGFISIFK